MTRVLSAAPASMPRWRAVDPASGHPRNAVPSWMPSAPSASAAAMPRPSMIPPARSTGTETRSTIRGTSATPPTTASSNGPRKVPRCPPASPDWATTASTPSRSSSTASATVVAVPRITLPASLAASSDSVPNVKLNTGTRSSATTASCASTRPGGGVEGTSCGSDRPSSARSGARTACIASTCSGSASGGGSCAKRLTANGRSVSRRIAPIASRSSSGPSVAPPSEPRAPAFETAATSSGVVKPPAIGACTIG